MYRTQPNPFLERKNEQARTRRSRRGEQLEYKRRLQQQREYVGENHQIDFADVKIENPYKSKNPMLAKDLNPTKQQEKLQRHTFSKYVNSYELDLMFFTFNPNLKQAFYLVLININTRFAYIVLIADKTKESIKRAISKLIYYGAKIAHVRYDGELALNSKDMLEFWNSMNIDFYSSSSKFTNKNRIVDRFIRTLRDLYFNNVGDKKLSHERQHDLMQQIVTYYNNTKHSSTAIAPAEMTYEQEYKYIETMTRLDKMQRQKQVKEGLNNFKNGDAIKVYLDMSKTQESFTKKRGNYVHDATFIEYRHGNVVCKINNKIVEIPIYWVKPKQ